jgi:Domain of unknown function (DUF4908)
MPRRGLVIAAIVLLLSAIAGRGQDSPLGRLGGGDIQTGAYTASNGPSFTLSKYDDKYLARFGGDPEIYVLYPDHGSLGGLVLKYDSGAIAMAVSGWGAVTIYTDAQPNGLPAERTGDADAPTLPFVSLTAMQEAATDEGTHLTYTRGLNISFDADWNALINDVVLRKQTFDVMENAARGIDRFAAIPAGRAALSQRLDAVHIVIGGRPQIALHNRTLLVTFSPSRGFAGRASSHGIARALGQMFGVPTAG